MSDEQREEYEDQHDASPEASAPEPDAQSEAPPPPVESLMGLRDYLTVAPRYRSDAVTKAAHTAMQRWMRLHGYDVDGFYSMEQWQACYATAMQYTG